MSSRSDHVEASHVPVKLHVVSLDLHVVVAEDAVRSVEETEQLRVRVDLLSHVKKTHDHIVSSCGLTSRKNASDFERSFATERFSSLLVDFDFHVLHAVFTLSQEGGEKILDAIGYGQAFSLELYFCGLDISDTGWATGHEVVTETLKGREGQFFVFLLLL